LILVYIPAGVRDVINGYDQRHLTRFRAIKKFFSAQPAIGLIEIFSQLATAISLGFLASHVKILSFLVN
jgi:serine/threonine protein kinase HipA of HipAB toxin-antitoxin module